jgi:hypothetical protein
VARIVGFERGELKRLALHDPIEAVYFEHEIDGLKVLQINTAGRSDRQNPGKVSQSIQLDEQSGKQLWDVLSNHFGFR